MSQPSKYTLRDHPKQKFRGDESEWVSTQNKKTNGNMNKETCVKCNEVFPSKKKLTAHEKSCLRLEPTESFLKYVQPYVVLNDIGRKIAIPSSQQGNTVDTDNIQSVHEHNAETTETAQTSGSNEQDSTDIQGNTVSDEQMQDPQDAGSNGPGLVVPEIENEDDNCPICKIDVVEGVAGICCDSCDVWYHADCLNMSEEEFQYNRDSPAIPWICSRCQLIRANNLKWGKLEGETAIVETLKKAYKEIISWRKNIMPLPRSKSGEAFIRELAKLLNLFVNKTAWKRLAFLAIHVFMPLMLQKPSARSKPREHSKYLGERLRKWNDGEIINLLKECKEIQKRMSKKFKQQKKQKEAKDRLFMRNMMHGKIGQAAKFVNNEDEVTGVHNLTSEIKEILLQKHPEAGEMHPDTILLSINDENPEPVIFEEIDALLVQKIAKKLKGSGGPTQIDADMWKDFTGAKALGKAPEQLCLAIADTAKILCTEEVHPECLEEFNACRLIPLDKGMTKDGTPGVRPIGIGEMLRRLIGKLLIHVIKKDITTSAGPLQTCSGLKAGIEAAIHAMRGLFEDEPMSRQRAFY